MTALVECLLHLAPHRALRLLAPLAQLPTPKAWKCRQTELHRDREARFVGVGPANAGACLHVSLRFFVAAGEASRLILKDGVARPRVCPAASLARPACPRLRLEECCADARTARMPGCCSLDRLAEGDEALRMPLPRLPNHVWFSPGTWGLPRMAMPNCSAHEGVARAAEDLTVVRRLLELGVPTTCADANPVLLLLGTPPISALAASQGGRPSFRSTITTG